jgi:hypothetical protein
MNRKRACLWLLSALILAGVGLALSLWHRPRFYTEALADNRPAEKRREEAQEFEQTALQLVNEVRFEEQWSHEVTDDMVNAWLTEVLPTKFSGSLPPGVSEPRVKFEEGHVLLAFQAQKGIWNGVVSSRIRAWAAGPNQLAFDLKSARAGIIPIPVDNILDDLVKKLDSIGWRAEWKRSNNRDVLVVNIDSENLSEEGPRAVLEAVEIAPGRLRISGRRAGVTESRSVQRADGPRSL